MEKKMNKALTKKNEKTSIFPRGFFWGAATSSYQVEGDIVHNDWAKAGEEGKVPKAGAACDHFHRYEEDFDIAKELGHNAHRLSLEWSRLEPREGMFDEEAFRHYANVLKAIRARGIEPFVTLFHFTLPLWFSESGGFERRDAPEIFARYAKEVAIRLSSYCTHFSTMNEPNVMGSNGWLRGSWPPFKRFSLTSLVSITNSDKTFERKAPSRVSNLFVYLRVMKHLAQSHNRAYEEMKRVSPALLVSVVKHVILFHSNQNVVNRLFAYVSNYYWTYKFMNRVKRHIDEIGLNYYFHKKYGDREKYEKSDMNWDIYPEGIEECLMMLSQYGKPLYVSESGVADREDRFRADYIERQVRGVARAIERGAPVRGHMYWSLLDNYEWALGYDMRFGLVHVDFETQKRTIRPSAYRYKEILLAHGVE